MINPAKNSNKSRWMFGRFWMPYLFFLLIPLVIAICIFSWSTAVLKDEVESVHLAALERFAITFENRITETQKLLHALSVDPNVIKYVNSTSRQTTASKIAEIELIKTVKGYAVPYDYLEMLGIYSGQLETSVLSAGAIDNKQLYHRMKDYGIDPEFVDLILSSSNFRDIYYFTDNTGLRIVCAQAVRQSPFLIKPDYAIAVLTLDSAAVLFESMLWTENVYIEMTTHSGTFIIDRSGVSLKNADQTPDMNYWSVVSLSQTSLANSYSAFIPRNEFLNRVNSIMLIASVILIVYLITGFIMSYLVAHKKYATIKRMIMMLEKSTESSIKRTDMKHLEDALNLALSELESGKRKIERDEKRLSDTMLKNLMLGRPGEVNYIRNSIEEYGLNLDLSSYFIALAKITDMGVLSSPSEPESETMQYVLYSVENVILELLRPLGNIESMYLQDTVLFIIPGNDTPARAELICQNLDRGIDFLHEHFSLNISTAVSSMHSSLDELRICYMEAASVLDYHDRVEVESHTGVYSEDDYGAVTKSEQLEQIAQLVREGEFKKAQHMSEYIDGDEHDTQPVSYIAERATKYIDEHLSDYNLNVATLAEAIGISRKQISSTLKKSVGMSTLEYIHLRRLTRAKELLRNTNLSIKDIADMLGYSNSSSTFNRVFLKYEGITPSKYRELKGLQ